MLALTLSFICFFAAGICRGIFECIIIFDTVRSHWGKYWSFDNFALAKDRNLDGKTTYLERTFPNDGGHRIKLAELWLYAIGATCMAFAYLWLNPLLPPAYIFACAVGSTLLQWLLISAGFLLSFSKLRKPKPKPQNYF